MRSLIRGFALIALCLVAAMLNVPASQAAPAPHGPKDVVCAGQYLVQGVFRNVTVAPGNWCIIHHSLITGDITADRATTFGLITSTVWGNVTVTRTSSLPNNAAFFGLGTANGVCSSKIHGDLTITDSDPEAPWDISSSNYPNIGNFSTCLSQIAVDGNVTFLRNKASANQIAGAVIGGNLVCEGNGGFVAGTILPTYPNKIGGRSDGQCAGNVTGLDSKVTIVPGIPHFVTLARPGDPVPSEQQWLALVAQNYRIVPL